ncbi:unnamed protein product [Owenia fusiformis]|uniref:Uncharacterized protein n=1 Tax=Owenia fusiformis TaxID=6347 RepID=A0A8J1XM11_OWEFU|nr:unnamed protein product [Owenia fusiformis]
MFLKSLIIASLAVCVLSDDKTKCAGKFDKEGSQYAKAARWTETLDGIQATCVCREESWFLWFPCNGDFCDDAVRVCEWDGCYSEEDGKAYAAGAQIKYRGRDCVCGDDEHPIPDKPSTKYAINC